MAVAAGRAADPDSRAERVAMVSRDYPLLEGGKGGVLLAALSLPASVAVGEVLGGAARRARPYTRGSRENSNPRGRRLGDCCGRARCSPASRAPH